MAAVVFVLVALVVLALLASVHRYVWRRFVGDTTAPGSTLRTVGTVAAFVLPLLSLGAMTSGRIGAPFWLQQVLAWPGFLWLACLMYLTLALLVGEVVRPLLTRVLARRDAAAAARATAGTGTSGTAVDGTLPATTSGTRPRTEELVPAGRSCPSTSADPAPATAPAAEPEAEAVRDTEQAAPAAPAETEPAEADPAAPASATGLAHPSRRLFVSRVVGGAAAAAGLATVGYGTANVLRGPSVKRITVPLAKLPRAAHGFRIAVVSDIHIGPILGRAHTRRIVDTINSTSPDLVAVVGDLVDGSVADLGSAAEPLAGLRARHGSFFVTGNHEYFSGAEEWVNHVRELGLIPLENARVEMGGFDLAGVNDIAGETEGQGPDFVRALGDRAPRPRRRPPRPPARRHPRRRRARCRPPALRPHPRRTALAGELPRRAGQPDRGRASNSTATRSCSSRRGAGAWGPPVRVGAPADITVVELASRQA
ncbi:Metallophosphoesterase OS=Streptomyces cyaneofuscatus OX=66883 GN=G3I52_24450 PE=4 SV=1 [Streptomyces cyaneofuscatus]